MYLRARGTSTRTRWRSLLCVLLVHGSEALHGAMLLEAAGATSATSASRLHHEHRGGDEDELIFVLVHRCLRICGGIEDQDQNEIAIFVLLHCCLPNHEGIEGEEDIVDLTCAW